MSQPNERRVTGLGGVFFKAKDPKAMQEWYSRHLGLPIAEWGGAVFEWRDAERPDEKGQTAWSIFPDSTKYFEPSGASFMLNYRVDDLDSVLAMLRAEGVHVFDKTDESEFGKFGWVLDPEGNKIELWQPPANAGESEEKS